MNRDKVEAKFKQTIQSLPDIVKPVKLNHMKNMKQKNDSEPLVKLIKSSFYQTSKLEAHMFYKPISKMVDFIKISESE